jgi:carbohydrate-binding DOMON domain-containing protein
LLPAHFNGVVVSGEPKALHEAVALRASPDVLVRDIVLEHLTHTSEKRSEKHFPQKHKHTHTYTYTYTYTHTHTHTHAHTHTHTHKQTVRFPPKLQHTQRVALEETGSTLVGALPAALFSGLKRNATL